MSSIEHFLGDGDIEFSREIERVLKPDGICVVSVPLISGSRSVCMTDWKWDMPTHLTYLLRGALPLILRKFNVDRSPTDRYLAKEYCMNDIFRRIVEPSGCVLEDSLRFNITMGTMIRTHIFPVGVLTPLDYCLAKFAEVGEKPTGGIVLKLRKKRYNQHENAKTKDRSLRCFLPVPCGLAREQQKMNTQTPTIRLSVCAVLLTLNASMKMSNMSVSLVNT